MELKFVDPRSLKDNPDKARRSKSSPQADALLLATIKAIGVVEPLIVFAEADGGNGFVIDQIEQFGPVFRPTRPQEQPLAANEHR